MIHAVFELVVIVDSSIGIQLFVVSSENNRSKYLCDKQVNMINTYVIYAKIERNRLNSLMSAYAGKRSFSIIAIDRLRLIND